MNFEKFEKVILPISEFPSAAAQGCIALEFRNDDEKIKIIETLWRIIYSNNSADIYEANLMRRLEGLLYIDSNIMGNIKDKIKKEKN